MIQVLAVDDDNFEYHDVGIRYLNASQQTDDMKPKSEPVLKLTRETQLCEKRNQRCNTIRETWTQMDRSGLVLDTSSDYSRKPGHYEDSKVWEEKRISAAIVIQRYARGKITRCKARKLKELLMENSEAR
jgi:hypothetical protein